MGIGKRLHFTTNIFFSDLQKYQGSNRSLGKRKQLPNEYMCQHKDIRWLRILRRRGLLPITRNVHLDLQMFIWRWMAYWIRRNWWHKVLSRFHQWRVEVSYRDFQLNDFYFNLTFAVFGSSIYFWSILIFINITYLNIHRFYFALCFSICFQNYKF